MKKLLFALAGMFALMSCGARTNSQVLAHEIDSLMIDRFYVTNDPHTFRIADTQTITGIGTGDYSASFYVDTEEWDFDPETNHIFSKIEFKKGNKILESFVDDEGWSYFGVELCLMSVDEISIRLKVSNLISAL